jgi:hypothetical protein
MEVFSLAKQLKAPTSKIVLADGASVVVEVFDPVDTESHESSGAKAGKREILMSQVLKIPGNVLPRAACEVHRG